MFEFSLCKKLYVNFTKTCNGNSKDVHFVNMVVTKKSPVFLKQRTASVGREEVACRRSDLEE